MSSDEFRALVLEQEDGGVRSEIKMVPEERLPEGDVVVSVAYSDLNYKDGMILKGLGRLVRSYPHVPGVDFSGTVERSTSALFKPGDPVILTGWRVGETRWGGYAAKARVPADWLVPLPDGLSLRQAMAIGTAGFTAMLAVMRLEEEGLAPDKPGEALVTGAAGGVGSVAVALLANLGYRVAAVTGRADTHDFLRRMGAAVIVDRSELETPPKGPLGPERWSAAIDNAGGNALGHILAGLRHGASCAAVGNAGGVAFSATVLPLLLRGVNLLGIDSVTCPTPRRIVAWRRLAAELPLDKLDAATRVAGLSEAPALAEAILKGEIRGRTVIDVGV